MLDGCKSFHDPAWECIQVGVTTQERGNERIKLPVETRSKHSRQFTALLTGWLAIQIFQQCIIKGLRDFNHQQSLTQARAKDYYTPVGAIVSTGFGILLMLVRTVTVLFGGFFYARSFSSLYGGLDGRASARRFHCHGIPIPFNLPPEFGISAGRNLTTWRLS